MERQQDRVMCPDCEVEFLDGLLYSHSHAHYGKESPPK